tara:strand:- start:10174 stop:11451 length:1278 start_codon:yes stop_codon:yes gene_type:complete
MASFNLTNFDAAMKHMYPYKKVENLVYQNNPLLAMIPKETNFAGRNATYAVEYGTTNGRSANFQTAQNNRNGTQLKDFVVTRVKDYAVVSVDNETLLAADGSEGSLLDVAKSKTDSALHALARSMGRDIYRSGSGSIGQLDDSVADDGTALTLVTNSDVVNFEVGMRIVAGDSAVDGATLANNGAAVEITGVNRDTGVLTLATAMETVWGIGSGDNADVYLYPEGDAANDGTNLKMSGLAAWIPTATPSATAFFGVDRTSDPTRLAGQRITATFASIRESLIDGAVRVAREGGRPDAVFMNPVDWASLAKDLEGTYGTSSGNNASRRRYDSNDSVATFGFSSLSLACPTGMLDLYSDHNCPEGRAYMLQMDTWKLKSLGPAPRLLDFDGLKGVRQANEDGVEYRWGYYGNLLCTAPGFNATIALA